VNREIDRARLYAYKLINYRPRAERELQRRLEHKGYSKEVTDIVIDYLTAQGYIEDKAFARYWVVTRSKKKGCLGLRRDLLEKGIDIAVINKSLALFGSVDEYNSALKIAIKKIALCGGSCPYPRLAGFLERRGFSYEVIYKVCQAVGGREV
jgi:regulatory protein